MTRDKVQFLAGFGLTPNAMAVAPVATEAKVPMIVMNAATSAITTKSPYIVRVSFTLPQVTAPIAEWAAKNKIKKVYTLVSDYGPGLDAEATFKKVSRPTAGRWSVRPRSAQESGVRAVHPAHQGREAGGGVHLHAGRRDRGRLHEGVLGAWPRQGGIKLIATGDVTDDDVIDAMGDAALGVITTHHYSAAHKSPENDAFKKAYADAGARRPNFMAVGGWDGMHSSTRSPTKLGGRNRRRQGVAAAKSITIQSPRGTITIDPATRDVVQDVYVRKVQKVDGKYFNVEFDKLAKVKDPGKS